MKCHGMFSEASVILFTGGGACVAGGHAWPGGGMCGRGCVAGGTFMTWGAWQRGMCGRGVRVAGEMTIAAGGTHPPGMHSCFLMSLCKSYKRTILTNFS